MSQGRPRIRKPLMNAYMFIDGEQKSIQVARLAPSRMAIKFIDGGVFNLIELKPRQSFNVSLKNGNLIITVRDRA